jgi:hypothetical protein
VTVDYYSADNTGATLDPAAKEYLISATPALAFTKKDTFGYDLNGQEYLVSQGGSYTVVDETYNNTTAKILSGTNNSTAQDGTGRQLTKDVNTGWALKDNEEDCGRKREGGRNDKVKKNVLASDIFTLWGMADLGSEQTDTYVLSMSFDKQAPREHFGNGGFGIATRDDDGKWVNAVDMNSGGTTKFVKGQWKSGYALGTYGVDASTKTAWAVINYNGDFAVARDIEPIPAHRKEGWLLSRHSIVEAILSLPGLTRKNVKPKTEMNGSSGWNAQSLD